MANRNGKGPDEEGPNTGRGRGGCKTNSKSTKSKTVNTRKNRRGTKNER